jgi:hypothetical protein
MSGLTEAAPQPATQAISPTPQQLLARFITAPISLETLTLLGNLSFGNAAFKLAVSEQPTIITLITDFAVANLTAPVGLQYAKTIKSMVVNSPPTRACMNDRGVIQCMLASLRLHGASDGALSSEVITSLCACAMNNDENTLVLQSSMVALNELEAYCAGDNRNEADLRQKVMFLVQLCGTVQPVEQL